MFFALGAYMAGWLGSGFFALVNDGQGLHIAVSGAAAELSGIHANFLLVVLAAVALTTAAGILIGVPTLRLRADYIAIVTLAFGEIIGRIAVNGDEIRLAGLPLAGGALESAFGERQALTAGRMGITPVDKIGLPGLDAFTALDLRPWYWTALALVLLTLFVSFRLRESRIGRAWTALREDEVAAVSMGVPSVKTKLLAYGIGAAFGGMAGAFLASYQNTVNADQFELYFSILILGMVVLGGMGSVWGVVAGAVALTLINFWLVPDVVNELPRRFRLDFDMTEVTFGFYGQVAVDGEREGLRVADPLGHRQRLPAERGAPVPRIDVTRDGARRRGGSRAAPSAGCRGLPEPRARARSATRTVVVPDLVPDQLPP